MAQRMDATTETIDASHLAFVSRPVSVAAFITSAVARSADRPRHPIIRPHSPPWRHHAHFPSSHLCAAVLAMGAVGSAAAASSPTLPVASRTHGMKPTIVLVHGAWADASSWSREITQLEHAGWP